MSQLLLDAGVNDFGGTLINESISTSAGSEFGQLMKPKEIRSLITSAGRVPAQRNSVYGIIKVFDENNKEKDSLLDEAEASKFGSYHELIRLDKFRYNHKKWRYDFVGSTLAMTNDRNAYFHIGTTYGTIW